MVKCRICGQRISRDKKGEADRSGTRFASITCSKSCEDQLEEENPTGN